MSETPRKPDSLPEFVQKFISRYPEVWSAYSNLGEAASEAGPLNERELRLVKLGIAIGARMEGAVHSHTRRALKAGLTPEELEQVALLAITTLGFPNAMASLSWIQDVTQKAEKRKTDPSQSEG